MLLCLIDEPVVSERWMEEAVCSHVTRTSLACSPVEDVADLLANVCPQSQELAVDPVESGFEHVSFSGVLAVKQTK